MFEETNQTEGTLEELFTQGEETAEPGEGVQGEPAGEGAGETAPAREPEEPRTFTVKYMGEERILTPDEMRAAAQKGMDYDRIRRERDELRSAPEWKTLDRIAREAGMTRGEFAQFLQGELLEREVAQEVAQGVPEPLARKYCELRRREEERAAGEQAAQREAAQRKLFVEFTQEYPEVRELPEEVKEAIRAGETPISAYRGYELRQLKAQLAATRQTQKNRAASVGSAGGDAPPEDGDGFLAGFLGELCKGGNGRWQ